MSTALTTNVDQRLLRTTKFPPEFNVKVDMKKVNLQLIKSWVQTEIEKILKGEDDVVTELVCNILDENRYPNIKELQISLTGFLDKDAAQFCKTLWKLCVSAQENPHGIPQELVEAKKAELTQAKIEEEKAREEAMRRQEAELDREREVSRIRDRERNERGRGRGGRGGRDFDRRPPRDSRSPPRRRRDDDDFRRAPRGMDTYVPGKARRDYPPRRRRSPSYGRSLSRSRSPRPRRRRRSYSPSRSPPRRPRRNTSSERSSSRDRGSGHQKGVRGGGRLKPRSPSPRPRSLSPRPRQRAPYSTSDRSRSPPPKRSRHHSPSPVRPSTSDSQSSTHYRGSPPPRTKKGLPPDDLMAKTRRKESYQRDSGRLSRESDTKPGAGAEAEESSFLKGASGRMLSTAQSIPSNPKQPIQQPLPANLQREAMLKAQVRAKMAAQREAKKRKDSAVSTT